MAGANPKAQDDPWGPARRFGKPKLNYGPVVVQLPRRLQRQHCNRLAQLTPEGWRLAEVAALMSQPFALEALARVMGEPVGDILPALRNTLSAGVMVPAKSALTFRHDLVRQAIYQQVPGPIREALLLRMETLAPDGGTPDESEAGHRPVLELPTYRSAQPAGARPGGTAANNLVGWTVPGDLALASAQAENVLGCARGQDADAAIAAALSTLCFVCNLASASPSCAQPLAMCAKPTIRSWPLRPR